MEWKWGIVSHPHYLLPSPHRAPPTYIRFLKNVSEFAFFVGGGF
jgi:hypothetical protein